MTTIKLIHFLVVVVVVVVVVVEAVAVVVSGKFSRQT